MVERIDVPGYEMLDRIAVGGMATIWKARQLSLNRIVAIKILPKDSLPNRVALEQFRQEAHAAAQLNNPGIVQVYDAGEVQGAAYIVMEYVEGASVGDMLLQSRLGEEEALNIVAEVGRALGQAWEKQRLVHCDIKPDNIMVALDGTVKVTDFGLARMMGGRAGSGEPDTIFGTPNYTSPEQVEDVNDIDCRSDIYELGSTLYHMVTGTLPFAGSPGSSAMERQITDTLADPQEIDPNLSVGMAWLIEKMMVKDRARRPPSWSAVLADIDAIRKTGMPLGPLPDEGLSTVRRAGSRATLPSRVRPSIQGIPATAERRKVVISREKMEQVKEAAERPVLDLGGAVRTLIILAVVTPCVYGGMGLFIRRYLEPVDRHDAPIEQAVAPTTFPEPRPVKNETWSEPRLKTTEMKLSIPGATWRDPEFVKAAQLFNRALAMYNNYQKTRTTSEDLKKVEADCRSAIRLFEACQPRAPEGFDIQGYITQCYGLISDVRMSTIIKPENRL